MERERKMEINNQGFFKGYASIFNSPDLTNDVIVQGAFRSSLERRSSSRIKMLYQHDASQVIGLWHKIKEDAQGLYVEGFLLLDVARALEIYTLLKAGALDGLSIGFRTVRASPSRLNYRIVEEIDLAEISIVTFPMHPEARINSMQPETEQPYLDLASDLRNVALNLNR
jgi:HK97 family phage prohead protease